jgi:predicted nucleotidyltransferase
VDATPYLVEIGRCLHDVRLEAVLIGNAAAALQGAPVTTVDFDFMFRKSSRNLQKLKALARALGATVLRPYYPASDLFRVVRDDGLQIDFMGSIHGIRSFEGLRDRSTNLDIDDTSIRIASLPDIIKSKKAARRPRDLAVLDVLERALEERTQQTKNARRARSRK